MLDIDKTKPVLVTGATGYVAGWIVKRLLEEGVTVHAAVRNPNDAAKVTHLDEAATKLPGRIRYFRADLLERNSYAPAMQDCAVVFHTASPFQMSVRDPQKELIDPAVLGTHDILETANRTESVRRVVLTSSVAAMIGDSVELRKIPGGVLTEEQWNTSSTLEHLPYSYAKTCAERAAWEIAGAQSRWKLVVLNPSFVCGPGVNPHSTGQSFDFVMQIGDGRMAMGAPDFRTGAVDVRDLAEAHLRAAWLPDAHGRYIISGHETSFLGIAQLLRPKYAAYPLPRRILPKWLLWLLAPLGGQSTTRRLVARSIGYPARIDNSKSRRELGISYRPLQTTIQEMFQQLIDNHRIPWRNARSG